MLYSISQIAGKLNLARSTLLYYERIGLVRPRRDPKNQYRRYSEKDLETLALLKQLQKAGFSLKEAAGVMEGRLDPVMLGQRYHALDRDIRVMSAAKEVVRALYTHCTGHAPAAALEDGSGESWYAGFERLGTGVCDGWLKRLGLTEKQRFYVRWITRNLGDNKDYMDDFFTVFEAMKRQGPGSDASTLKAFNAIPDKNRHQIRTILDIGCGKGVQTMALARNSHANILAVDTHQPFLEHLDQAASRSGFGSRVRTANMSMTDLDIEPGSVDLIWAEGSAYLMGFENALVDWKPVLRRKGFLFVSEAVWLTREPPEELRAYWDMEYPDMKDAATREEQAEAAGYTILSGFILPKEDWQTFYDDMTRCADAVIKEKGITPAIAALKKEIRMARQYGDDFSYLCLLLQRKD